MTEGKISNAHLSRSDVSSEILFQHTAPIDPGSSGGPLTNEAGELVGVNVALVRGRSSMFFAVPAASVAESVRHELVERRRSSAWMNGQLTASCDALAAELASAAGSVKRVDSFVSNDLVATEGMKSFAFVVGMGIDVVAPKPPFEAPAYEATERGRADDGDDAGAVRGLPPAAKPARATERPAPGAAAPEPFSMRAARASVGDALDTLPICRRGDASGPGVAEIVFAPSGEPVRIALSRPYAGTETGACVARRFARASVPAFSGGPMALRVRFAL